MVVQLLVQLVVRPNLLFKWRPGSVERKRASDGTGLPNQRGWSPLS